MDVRVGPDLIALHLDDHVLVCDPDGRMSRDAGHGFFAADTRFVSGYRLRLGGIPPVLLTSAAVSAFGARFEFTNPSLWSPTGDIEASSLRLRVERALGGGLHEDYDLVNYGPCEVEVTMEISLESDFVDIFEVKDQTVVRRGVLQSDWADRDRRLTTRYRHDDFERSLSVRAERSDSVPEFANGGISFRVRLAPGRRWHTCLVWEPASTELDLVSPVRSCHALRDGAHSTDEARRSWLAQASRFSTSAAGPDDAASRAVDDLAGLRLHQLDALATGDEPTQVLDDARWVPAAGVPWFMALFGRDSLVVALQTLALSPMFPVGALHALGALQGDGYDDARDMQPGKILHELRRGEPAGSTTRPAALLAGSSMPPSVSRTGDSRNYSLACCTTTMGSRCRTWVPTFPRPGIGRDRPPARHAPGPGSRCTPQPSHHLGRPPGLAARPARRRRRDRRRRPESCRETESGRLQRGPMRVPAWRHRGRVRRRDVGGDSLPRRSLRARRRGQAGMNPTRTAPVEPVETSWTQDAEPLRAAGPGTNVTLVDGATFAVSARSGDIDGTGPQGLYVSDTRVLDHLVLRPLGRDATTVSTG